jgi:hypothetical protein
MTDHGRIHQLTTEGSEEEHRRERKTLKDETQDVVVALTVVALHVILSKTPFFKERQKGILKDVFLRRK